MSKVNITVHKDAYYIMKNHAVYQNSKYSINQYCIYSQDFRFLGCLDMTSTQAKEISIKYNIAPISPMDVFRGSKGTMGFKNLPDEKLQQFKQNFGA